MTFISPDIRSYTEGELRTVFAAVKAPKVSILVAIDDGCGLDGVFYDNRLCYSTWEHKEINVSTGAGGHVYNKGASSVFGDVAYSADLPYNLLGQTSLMQNPRFRLSFDLKSLGNNKPGLWKCLECLYLDVRPVYFQLSNKIYIGDLADWYRRGVFQQLETNYIMLSQQASELYLKQTAFSVSYSPHVVGIVSCNSAGTVENYSKRQLERDQLVLEYMKRMGCRSYYDMRKQVMGHTQGLPFDVSDVDRAQLLHPNDITTLQGKHHHHDGLASNLQYGLHEKELYVESDLFKSLGLWHIISIAVPTHYSIVSCLNVDESKPRDSLNVQSALVRHVEILMGFRWTVVRHVSDGERGIVASHPEMNRLGVSCNTLAKDSSPTFVDNRIKLIKETARSVLFSLDMLPKCLRFWLIRFANSSINDASTKSNPDSIPASVAMTGIPLTAADFPAKFGQYVEASEHGGVKHNRIDISRTLPGLFLGRGAV